MVVLKSAEVGGLPIVLSLSKSELCVLGLTVERNRTGNGLWRELPQDEINCFLPESLSVNYNGSLEWMAQLCVF